MDRKKAQLLCAIWEMEDSEDERREMAPKLAYALRASLAREEALLRERQQDAERAVYLLRVMTRINPARQLVERLAGRLRAAQETT